MALFGGGPNDYLADGDWNAACYECGRKFKGTMLKKHWQGYWVCPAHWEQRQPQDFVRSVPDVIQPPFIQPEEDTFVVFCSLQGRMAVAGVGVAGCMIAGYVVWDQLNLGAIA